MRRHGIENHFFGDWFDVMIRLEGDIVNQLQIHFLSSWRWQGGSVGTLGQRPDLAKLRQHYFPGFHHRAGKQKAKLLVNIPDPGLRAIKDEYKRAVERTRESFYFMNPYCFTDWIIAQIKHRAEELYKKGKSWQPAMSQPAGVLAMFASEGFGFPMNAALEHELPGLNRARVGVLIYPGVLHGKLYVQDRMWSNIGSCNIDDASFERNWEANILVEDKNFADEVLNTLFKQNEDRAEIKVDSTLQPSLAKRMVNASADQLDKII